MTGLIRSRSLHQNAAVVAVLLLGGAFALPAAAQTTTPAATTASDSTRKEGLIINRIVAVVNNDPIMMSEIMDRVIKTAQRTQAPPPDSAGMIAMQAVALQEAIDDLLLQQKAKAEKVEVAETDVQQAAGEDFKEVRQKFGSDAEFARAIREAGFGSVEDFKKTREDETRNAMVKRNLIEKMRNSGRIPAVNVTEAEVTAEYERNKDALPKREASASFRQIIFPVDPSQESKRKAKAKIDSIAKELEERPQDFENIAKRVSQDNSKELGGDLGWLRRGTTVPEFDRAIFALNPGIVSPVIETVYGYHLIRVDRVQAAEVKARHILIKFPIDTTDEERAFQLADSVAKAWRAGANYDSLSAEFHDTKNQEERGSVDFPVAQLPVSYQNAIKDHKDGDIIGPFTIHDERNNIDKPVLMQLTDLKEAGDYTLAEVRQRIRSDLANFRSMRRFLDTLRGEAYVWTLEPQKAVADKKNQ